MTELNPAIKNELLQRAEAEQALRKEWGDNDNEEIRLKVLAQDADNTIFLKYLIKSKGWPKMSEVGKEVAMAAWLIAQHSPDRAFRKHCLELMQEAPEEVEPQNLVRTIVFVSRRVNSNITAHTSQKQKVDRGFQCRLKMWSMLMSDVLGMAFRNLKKR
jgi:hypothetical protein